MPTLLDADQSREARAADLAELIAFQRRVVERLEPCDGPGCEELIAQQRILHHLSSELRSLTPDAQAVPQTPLEAARRVADIFQFAVPPSHRTGVGAAVTTAKRAFVEGLKPFHIEALRPQRAFNEAVLEVVDRLVTRGQAQARGAMDGWVKARLEPLADPAQWRPAGGHRRNVAGAAARLAKGSYLGVMGAPLRGLLEGQRRWNGAIVEALARVASGREVNEEEGRALVARLSKLVDPLAREDLPAPVKVTGPLWREVLRRQTTFNREVVLAIANLVGSHMPDEGPRTTVDYTRWYEAREPREIARAAEAYAALPAEKRPLISIITPVWETPEPILRACVESVLAQQYREWEWVLADDGSKSPAVQRVLREYAARDARLKVVRLEQNGGIARATNAALAEARGEYVALLDHDDTLAPHALTKMALCIAEDESADVLYSDEDRLDTEGRRCAPFFKPGWSPDLLRSVNYLCHFTLVRRALMQAVGGLREGFEGSQDYDLFLRLSEKTQHIAHVPGILYHWRASPISLSQDERKLQAASDAGVRALKEHLARLGEDAEVDAPAPTSYRVRYRVEGEPLVSIIVPFKDKPELLEQLLGTLLPLTRYQNYELLLVSNNSTREETFRLLESLSDPRIRKLEWNHPFNYPAINNWAAGHAKGELLLFLNNDISIVDPDWLHELVGHALRPEVGMVGPKLLFPDGTIQHAGVVIGIQGSAAHPFWRFPDAKVWTPFGHADWTRNYLAVTSACVMMRRQVFEELKGYDERFLVCGSDVDLGLRSTRRELRVVYTPHTKLIHHESASRRLDAIPENDFWMSFAAYRDVLREGDPFYNPNLTLLGTNCDLRTDDRSPEALGVRLLVADLPSSRQPLERARVANQRHLIDHLAAVDHSAEEAEASRREEPQRLARLRQRGKLESVSWFIPSFTQPYGGLHTVFRFADVLRRRHGVKSRFVVSSGPQATAAELEARVATLYPELPGTFEIVRDARDIAALSPSDLAVATVWSSAYQLLRYRGAGARAYLVQDFEPQFYAAGTEYGLAEQSYRLGYFGIFNTPGLHDFITQSYGMPGAWFEPSVDHDVFHAEGRSNTPIGRSRPARVFFYGRPTHDRNAFELGIAVLRALKRELGSKVEIISAGAQWRPEEYGLGGVITNAGVLSYEETGSLYRSCDAGLAFMFTKHPSYLPLEMMACGVTVVTNLNPANTWLFRHEENCLLAEPTVTCVLDQLRRAVTDAELNRRIGAAAAQRMLATTWEAQIDAIYDRLVR